MASHSKLRECVPTRRRDILSAQTRRAAAFQGQNQYLTLISLNAKELNMSRTFLSRVFCVLTLALLAVAPVGASDPYNPNACNPYSTSPPQSVGPAVPPFASASVIRATGNLAIQHEMARVDHEQANQAVIQTRRMAFDEGIYEARRSPSYFAELDPWTQAQIRRDIAEPAQSAIVHGDTLNQLLPYVTSLVEAGTQGDSVPLSADTLSRVNVEVGMNGASPGLLSNGGHISWPLMLKGAAQVLFDGQITAALEQVNAGTLTPATYTALVNDVNAMRNDLRTKFFHGDITTDAYQSNNAFLDVVANSLTILQRPDAARFLDGTYAARGNTVADLVEHMAASGLQFAPALPGSESAYFALHNAFVSYIHTAESAAFASTVAPPAP
jgi:hypothetical protein